MSIQQGCKVKQEEKRNYFRVDDAIPVIANPAHRDKCKESSRVLSISEMQSLSAMDVQDSLGNQNLCNIIMEINAKLDFIINHFLLEKEGLLSAEKKMVNLSAAGIRFTVNHPVSAKDIMEIKLLLPTCPPVAVLAYGEVKRVKALKDGTYEVALQYLNMDSSVRDEIIQYTLNHQRETVRRMKDVSMNE